MTRILFVLMSGLAAAQAHAGNATNTVLNVLTPIAPNSDVAASTRSASPTNAPPPAFMDSPPQQGRGLFHYTHWTAHPYEFTGGVVVSGAAADLLYLWLTRATFLPGAADLENQTPDQIKAGGFGNSPTKIGRNLICVNIPQSTPDGKNLARDANGKVIYAAECTIGLQDTSDGEFNAFVQEPAPIPPAGTATEQTDGDLLAVKWNMTAQDKSAAMIWGGKAGDLLYKEMDKAKFSPGAVDLEQRTGSQITRRDCPAKIGRHIACRQIPGFTPSDALLRDANGKVIYHTECDITVKDATTGEFEEN